MNLYLFIGIVFIAFHEDMTVNLINMYTLSEIHKWILE